MKYVISGEPIPKLSVRFNKLGRAYNSQDIIMKRCKLELIKQHKKQPLFNSPLHLELYFFMPMPNYWTQIKKERMVGEPHIARPDYSNLLKLIEDCGTGTIYTDDKLIYSITGTKTYDWFPRTEFTLTEIKI